MTTLGKWWLVLFFGLFVVVGIFAIGATINEYQQYLELRDTGQEARGRFIEKRFSTSTDDNGNTSYTYYVTFRFNIGEEGYNVEEQVDKSVYDTADNGEPLFVTYAADNPTNATIEPVGLGDTIAVGIFAGIWNCIVWVIIAAFAFSFGIIRWPFRR